MQKKRIEKLPFGEKKVHRFDDCLVIDGTTTEWNLDRREKKNARVCLRKTEFANYVEGKGWNTRKIEGSWMTSNEFKFDTNLNQEEEKIVEEFWKAIIQEERRWRGQRLKEKIEQIQEYINEKKRETAWKNRREKIKVHAEEIRPMTEKMKKWVNGQMPAYSFYKTEKDKSTAVCCRCGKETVYDRKKEKIIHNQEGICQHCKRKVTFKASGRQQKIIDRMRFVRFQKTKFGVAAIESSATKISRAGEESQLKIGDTYIWFVEEKYVLYDDYQGQEQKASWSDVGRYGIGNYPHGKARIYKGNLKQAIKGSLIEYSGIDVVADWNNQKEAWEDILVAYASDKGMEKIIKAGMKNLTRQLSKWMGDLYLCYGTKLHEILGITRKQAKMAREHDFGKKEIRVLRNDTKEELSAEEVEGIAEAGNYLAGLKQYTTIRKITTYIKKGNDAGIWMDYLVMADETGYNMKDKAVLFPGKLNKKHNELVKIKEIKKNQEKEELYQRRKDELEHYRYKTKSYLIVIPETLGDIIVEGQQLHHCVGTYIEKVAKGKTDILFIREVGKEDIPFYTMEVRNMEIIQYRGAYNNCNNNPVQESVKKFVKQFEQTVLNRIRKVA